MDSVGLVLVTGWLSELFCETVLDTAAALAVAARDDERVGVGALLVDERVADNESEKDGVDVSDEESVDVSVTKTVFEWDPFG
jgi:hypothetical protein